MKRLRRVVALCGLAAMSWCGWAGGQQVLEQVPSDAVGVIEVKDLQGVSAKLAKFAKGLGIDQFDPRWADPLASLMDQMDLKQGVNKGGDMAIAFFNPEGKKAGRRNAAEEDDAAKQPPFVVLVPTSDYQQFLGNFQDVKDAGNDLSQVSVPKNHEKLFVAHRGEYAVAAMDKSLLSDHAGLKLKGPAAKEAQSKDAILYIDLKALRPLMEKGLKQGKVEMDKAQQNQAGPNPFATPQMKKMMEQYFNAADEFIKDARSTTISLNLTDTGIGAAALTEFESDSYLGKLIAKVQNTDKPLLAGLPKATYFAFGGAKLTPEVVTQLFTDFLEPLEKELAKQAKGEDVAKAFDAAKQVISSMNDIAAGYAAPAAPNQGLVEVVAVAHGNAQEILKAQKQALPAVSAMVGMSGPTVSADVSFDATKTVDGVEVQPYTLKFNIKGNDFQAMQARQMLTAMYGRNGVSGTMAAVNDNTFLSVQGGGGDLLSDAIAAAKDNTDALSQMASLKQVSSQLPHERAVEFYVALDNIANAAVKFMKQQGMPVQFRLPPNLPPIGVSAGSDESAVRFDAFIPTDLVNSMTAAAMQAWMQMNGGPAGAGHGGGI